MKLLPLVAATLGVIVSIALLSSCSPTKAAAGPNGGDLVPIQSGGGAAKAEVVTNANTGEVMVHTWDTDLKNHQPIDATPMSLGSGDHMVELQPYPLPADPPGRCSRFYGQAEWVRDGKFDHGWLQCCGGQGTRHEFPWSHCWSGGQGHDGMWGEMGEHRRGPMGPPGMGGHR
jgi:hypothetical protein